MARIVTVNVPQYAVRAKLGEILGIFGSLTPDMQTATLALTKTTPTIDTEVDLVCPSEAVAKAALSLFAVQTRSRTVKVDSFSRYGANYNVVIDGNTPTSCDCPDFVNRSIGNPSHQCKHILHVLRSPFTYGLT